MEFPYLKNNQFAVGQAAFATGHVLRNDGLLFLKGQKVNEAYEIFDKFEEAKKFAINKVNQKPEMECYIFDSKGKCLFACDKNGERK